MTKHVQIDGKLIDVERTLFEIERADAEGSLVEFVRQAWHIIEPGQPYIHGWHIDFICAHLEAITDGVELEGGEPYNRLLINVPPGPGWVENLVTTARGRVRLGDLMVGDMVLTHRGRYRPVTACYPKGVLPTLRITTKGGRETIATPDHNFLTPGGWVEAGRLRVGDTLAFVTPVEDPCVGTVSPEEARLLGYLVGDGSMTQATVGFTNQDEDVIADFESCAAFLGFKTTKTLRNTHWQVRLNGGASVRDWLASYGLCGASSYTKFIPQAVISSSSVVIKNFIGAYWSCDGMFDVRSTQARGSRYRASATTVSERLARDLQHALSRIGIRSLLRKKSRVLDTAAQPGGVYQWFNVEVYSEADTARFIDMPGLSARKNKIASACSQRRFDAVLNEDPIVSIEPAGDRECMCVSVEEDHSLVWDDIVVHNTMKSLLSNVFWPAWWWGPRNEPYKRFLCASHSQSLAIRDSTKMRRLIASQWYQERWGDRVTLTRDQNAKCLLRGTQITMADGSLRSIQDVRPGEYVLSYDLSTNSIVADKVMHVWSNGEKPARRITLSDGTSITATLNHRLFGWEKFVFTPDMKVGDPLAVMERSPNQAGDLSVDDAFLLALWLAEGSKTNSSFMFSNGDPLILARVRKIALKRGWSVRNVAGYDYLLTSGAQTGDTPMGVLKRYLGTDRSYGSRTKLAKTTADEIRIPPAVFSASDASVREFVSTYIATDGCVTNGQNHALDIVTVSERMARDFAALLKRFGVSASIYSQKMTFTYKGERKTGRTAWRTIVRSGGEIAKLADLHLYGKDEKFRGLLAWCQTKKRHEGARSACIPPHDLCPTRWSSKRTAVERAELAGDHSLAARLTGGLSWRKIVAIEEVELCETWHMETERTHLFFAEGVLSHNTKFETTATGFREAVAAGSITGSRGDVVIIDDPHSVEGAASDAMRQSTLEWFTEAVPTRLNNPRRSAIVVIMQRLHEEDVSGVIINRKLGYDHIMLPMRFEPGRAKATMLGISDPREEEGELLFPARFPEDVVDRDERVMGPYATAGQHQQNPEPRGGGIIKRAWWKRWDRPAYPPFSYVVAALDTAYTEKEENDPSAMTVWGIFSGGDQTAQITRSVNRHDEAMQMAERAYTAEHPKAMLIYAWTERLELHDLVEKVRETVGDYGVDHLLIEDRAAGHSVAQELRRIYGYDDFGVQLVNPGKADKVARLYSVQHLFADGLVYAPERTWAEAVINQVAQFPKGKHDDLTDTLSMAMKYLRESGLIVRSSEHSSALDSSRMLEDKSGPLYPV